MLRELNIEKSLTISKSINWQKKEFLECRIYEPETAWNYIDDNLINFHTDLPTSISLFNDELCITRGDVPNKLNGIIFNFLFVLHEIKNDCDFKISNEEKKFLLSDIKKFFEFLKCLTNEFLEANDLVSFKSLCDFLLKWLNHMGDIVENMMEIRIYDNISENFKFHLYIIIYSSMIEIFTLPTEEIQNKIYLENGLILLPKLIDVVMKGYLIGLAWFTDKLIVTPLCTCFYNSIYQISKKNCKDFWKHIDKTIQIVSQCQATTTKQNDICDEFLISLYTSNLKLTPAYFFTLLKILHNFYKSLCLPENTKNQLCFPVRMIVKNIFPSLVQTRKENLSVYLFTIYEMLSDKPVKEYEYCDSLITYSIHALVPTFSESSTDNILEDIFDSEDIYKLHCNLKNFFSDDKNMYGRNQQSWCIFVRIILLISRNNNVWTKNENKIFHLLNIRRLKQVTNITFKKLILLYFGIFLFQKSNIFKNITELLYYCIDECDTENRILRLRLFAILIVKMEVQIEKDNSYIELFKKFAIDTVNCISMLPECMKIDNFLYEFCNVRSCLENSLVSITEIHRGNIESFLDIIVFCENLILWDNCWRNLIGYWSNPRKYFLDKIDSRIYNTISLQLKIVSKIRPLDLPKFFEVILSKCTDKFSFKCIPKVDLIQLIELYLNISNDIKIFSNHTYFLSVWFCVLLTFKETTEVKRDKLYFISARLCKFVGNEFTSVDEFLEDPDIKNFCDGGKYLINYVFSGIKSISDVNISYAKQLITNILSNDFFEIIKESFKNDCSEKTDFFIYFTVELFSNLTHILISMQQNVLLTKSLMIRCCQTFLETTIEILKKTHVYESKMLIDHTIMPLLVSFLKLNLKDMDYLRKLTIKIFHLVVKDEYFLNYKCQELSDVFPHASTLILDAKALNY